MINKKIYIIAGEASGDNLGAKLIANLKLLNSNIEFKGVGGSRMVKEGFSSLFDMSELSLMGFTEILPHLPKLLKRIKQTVADIEQFKPDLVITIDSPGFNNQIAKNLQGKNIKLMHYVAPSVWAYKPKRAEKLASRYDYLLTILPFEEPYFKDLDLITKYIGHPIIEEPIADGDAEKFRETHGISNNAKILCILPGSRATEINKLLPIFKDSVDIISNKYPDLSIVIPTIPRLKDFLQLQTKNWKNKVILVDDLQEKYNAFAATDAAIVKSGTVALEIAIAKIPHVVTYKVNYLSYLYIKSVVKIKYANLINLILNKLVIPEYLQYDCTSENLSKEIMQLLSNKDYKEKQLTQISLAINSLGANNSDLPSRIASKFILSNI